MMSHLSLLFLAATLGQAPAESGWLDSVPHDADIVLRIRGLDASKDQIVAMLKAMSPALAAQAEPALERGIALAKVQAGEQAATEPLFILLRGVSAEGPGFAPFAVMVKSSNYETLLKSLSGGKDPEIKHLVAGYDSFKGPGGQPWFAARRDGTVAFGGDQSLIEGYSKPDDKAVGKTMSPSLRKKFLAGDVGVYFDVDVLATRYAEPIAKAEQGLLDTFDKLGPQMGSGMVDFMKSIYRGMFGTIKEADGLALSFDFNGEGMGLSGVMTVKADATIAKAIARTRAGDAAQLAKFPADSTSYIYTNLDADTFRQLQMMTLQMIMPGGKTSSEVESAIAKEADRVESNASMSMGGGFKMFQIANLTDPQAYVTACVQMMKLMQGADAPLTFYKDIKITPGAETYRGFAYTRIDATLDFDKFAKLQPGNPAFAESMKSMYGGNNMTTWLGVGDKQIIQLVAPTWADARSQIDAHDKGEDCIGTTSGFKATRAKLPRQVSVLMLMSAQGYVRQLTSQLSTMMPNAPKQPPTEMSKDPALIGFSLAPAGADAIEFQMFVPSTVGPVFEKGLVPVFSSPRPAVKP